MKIAIITPYAEPEYGACTKRVKSFERYFIKKGHNVRIFAQQRGNILINYGNITRYKGLKQITKTLLQSNFDAVIGTSPPILPCFASMIACKIRRIPFILDIRDPFTDSIKLLGLTKSNSPKFLFFKCIEYLTHRFADKITAVTEYDVRQIISRYHRKKEDVIFATNGTDLNPDLLERDKSILKKIGIPADALVLFYAGSLKDEGIETMLTNLRDLFRKYKRLYMILAALSDKSAFNERVISDIKQLISEDTFGGRIKFFSNISDKEVLKYELAADIALDPLTDAMFNCIPAKTYEYMACGLPIIAIGPQGGALNDFFKRYDIGIFANNWDEFKSSTELMINNIDKFLRKSKKSKKIVKKHFLRSKTAEIVLETLKSVIRN